MACGCFTPRDSANEFLYDQCVPHDSHPPRIFHLLCKLCGILTHHTAEEAQKLTDQTVPVPPWCYDEQVMIPQACCSKSADLLQQYFGPEMMRSFVGGERWWQMRSRPGIPADWISHYSDYHSAMAKRGHNVGYSTAMVHRMTRDTTKINPRHEHASQAPQAPNAHDAPGLAPGATPAEARARETGRFADTVEEEARLERIVLYIHGGAYYFGSVNTHKYAIHRLATKFGGFALAVNYRKAPQFPFPCAIQDCLAAYLYLLDPPPGALHRAVDPTKIVIAGDSAGGGLALALLQLIRDLDLPRPAGGVLISPWSDLTHSFPSILQNTKTDYIPPYSFIHRPSVLWPPPRDTDAFFRPNPLLRWHKHKRGAPPAPRDGPWHAQPLYVPRPDGTPSPIRSQIQLYATNAQLRHPLCSPALAGSLGGLPPLYIIAGDDEVLRDEILYVAHKAAHPTAYPTNPSILDEFPQARAAERFNRTPTDVHVQLFDGQCHVFPMFLYTPAARFAFRAAASFIKAVTGAPLQTTGAIAQSRGQAPRGENKYSSKVPLERPQLLNHMIRERVARDGQIRPMESAANMPALQLAPAQIGVIHRGAYERFRKGHQIWDKRYHSDVKRIKKRRAHYERRARQLLAKAESEGLLSNCGDIEHSGTQWTDLGTYGPADLRDEAPPPTAIVGRRDTPDALALLRLGLHLRAKRRRARGIEARPDVRHSLADDAPRRDYAMGEHVHKEGEQPVALDRFSWWRRLFV